MSNKYFIKTGLNEFSVNPNFNDDNVEKDDVSVPSQDEQPTAPDNSSDMKNPFTNDTQEVDADVTPKTPTKSALGGYDKVENAKENSTIYDKTPENSDLNDPSQLKNDQPETEEEEHPYQLQAGEVDDAHELEVDIENPSELGIDKPDIRPAGTPEQETPEPNSNQDALAIKVDESVFKTPDRNANRRLDRIWKNTHPDTKPLPRRGSERMGGADTSAIKPHKMYEPNQKDPYTGTDMETGIQGMDEDKSGGKFMDEKGTYPAFAWPGMYPLYYITKDGGALCPLCADQNKELTLDPNDAQWFIVASEPNYENADLTCDHCNQPIESAYADKTEPERNPLDAPKGERDVLTADEKEEQGGMDEDSGQALPLSEKISKLKALKESYARKPFLTMKQVLLVKQINEVLKKVK